MNKFIQKFFTRLFRYFSRKSVHIADRIEFQHSNNEIFRYMDCFTTIKTLRKFLDPKILCDIGAYKGYWSYVLNQIVPLEQVVLFEPQRDFQSTLEELDLGDAKKYIFHCALGENQGKMKLTGGTHSASILTASKNQFDYFPGSLTGQNEYVIINTLDEIYQQNGFPAPDIIKLDVQGYELNVLKGGISILQKTKYLIIEISCLEFYLGQPPLWQLLKFLDEQNFVLVDQGHVLRSRKHPFEMLQFDGIFMNKNLVNHS
ncbi:MAG: FkbM family methyltransferase [Desulfobulbaceae bacterium]